MEAKDWYAQRTKKVKGLRGEYEVQVPDLLQLIQDWAHLGITDFNTDLGQKISDPKVIKTLILKYLKSPKVSTRRTQDSISIKDLMKDQAATLVIYSAIISEFTTDPDKVSNFFRNHFPKGADTTSGTTGALLSQTSNKDLKTAKSDSIRRDPD